MSDVGSPMSEDRGQMAENRWRISNRGFKGSRGRGAKCEKMLNLITDLSKASFILKTILHNTFIVFYIGALARGLLIWYVKNTFYIVSPHRYSKRFSILSIK